MTFVYFMLLFKWSKALLYIHTFVFIQYLMTMNTKYKMT